MKRAFTRRGLRATLTLAALGTAGITLLGTSAFATASTSSQAGRACVSKPGVKTRVGHISGVVGAVPTGACAASLSGRAITKSGDNAKGAPPLIWHGGAVMGTKLTGPLVVTPIFWSPAGHPMDASYKSLITRYLGDVAKASGTDGNVFSISTEYSGTDGKILYQIKLGTPINDTNPLPTDLTTTACTVETVDTANIYADNSGYDACIADQGVIDEASNVVAALHLARDERHIYVVYLPKHVESCFSPGSSADPSNACTINYQPSAAYCAYHSFVPTPAGKNLIYANMPFPIYLSKVGFTCGTNKNFGVIETPNHNPDADTEISPTSHEINEAWTDPDTSSGWYDIVGFEDGDECAYIFGHTHGTAGHLYNQVINGHHYLTQEEFSNHSFFASGGGCLQGE
jgi:hypothetical protein